MLWSDLSVFAFLYYLGTYVTHSCPVSFTTNPEYGTEMPTIVELAQSHRHCMTAPER